MESTQLKQAIADDLAALKQLDLDVMPSKTYYRANAYAFGRVFLRLYGLCLGACILPALCRQNWHEFFAKTQWLDSVIVILLSPFAFTLFSLFFLHSAINHYVIFTAQIQTKLKAGSVLAEKMRFGGWLAYGFFGMIVCFATFIADPELIFFAEAMSTIPALMLTSIIVEMETNRIGISALSLAVNQYLSKDKGKEDNLRPST